MSPASRMLLLSGTTACAALAQAVPSDPQSIQLLEPMTVTGGAEAVWKLPGSASLIEAKDFRASGYVTFSKIAAKIPGLYVREEDGHGNFLNISLRGTDGTRSNKVSLMEDGILTSPSPYSAPAAYYSPKVARMAGIEVLKGSSQIAYGPHTTGGVVNFLSTPVPAETAGFARITGGNDSTLHAHGWIGGAERTDHGTFGWLVELHGQTTEGYRDIDGTDADSGFEIVEPMVKLYWEPDTALRQHLELKVGYTRFDANESYSGLTTADLRSNPDRRYAASQFDRLESDQWRTYLKYIARPSDALNLESALYYNSFERIWDKLDGLAGTGLRTNVGQALLHAPSYAVLQGLGTGDIITRAAFRDHEAMGWQNQADYRFETGPVDHQLSVGLRVHEDSVDGTNQAINYASNGAGGFGPARPGAIGSAGTQEVLATAVFIEDEIGIGSLTLRPGVRYEHLDWENISGAGARATGAEALFTAGVGFTQKLAEGTSVLGGVYQGASPANPAGFQAGTKSERSLGYELGLRHRAGELQAEIIGFYTDFQRLIAPQVGIGAGGVAPSSNAGKADVLGVESIVSYDFGKSSGLSFGIPAELSATWTQAEFKGIAGNGRLGNNAGVFAGAVNGNEIPYIPEWKLGGGIGIEAGRWGVRADFSYVGETWGTGYNDDPRLNDNAATLAPASELDGRIDSLFLVDVSGFLEVRKGVKLVAGVQNVFNERGIISRLPLGPRANSPRYVYGGFEVAF